MNNATCVNDPSPGSYSCSCLDGFTRSHCEADINECMLSPCLNGATCMDGINQYDCICADGYSSENCSVDIHDHLPKLCVKNRACSDMVNGLNHTLTGYT